MIKEETPIILLVEKLSTPLMNQEKATTLIDEGVTLLIMKKRREG